VAMRHVANCYTRLLCRFAYGPADATTSHYLLLQSNLGRVRRRPIASRPIGYNGTPKIHQQTQNFPFPSTITTPFNTPIPRQIQLTTPNGIRIQSAVLPRYTFRTDVQADRPTDGIGNSCVHQERFIRSVTLLVSNALKTPLPLTISCPSKS